jgi:hypothetical protein
MTGQKGRKLRPRPTERVEGGVKYITAEPAARLLGVSHDHFYEKSILSLTRYFFDGRRRPWYKEEQVADLKAGRIAQNPVIAIEGMYKDWTTDARALGIPVTTGMATIRGIQEPLYLPEEVCAAFGLDGHVRMLCRARFSMANKLYLCTWDTYWPYALVEEFLPAMKTDPDFSVSRALAAKGRSPVRAVEEVSSRHANLYEQEQMQMVSNEPILVLQRACYGQDGTFVLFSDMSLRGSFFKRRYEFAIPHWK